METDNLTSIRRSLQFLVVIAALVAAYFTRDLLLPIVLAFLLSLTLSPLSRTLHKVGIPHVVSAFLLVATSAVVILAIIGGTASTLAMWSDDIPQMVNELKNRLVQMNATVEDMRSVTDEVRSVTETQDPPQEVVMENPGLLDTAFSTLAQVGASFAVTMVLSLFLLSSGELFYLKIVQSFPTLTGKKRALTTVYTIERSVSRYLLTITVINAVLGLLVGTFLHLLGLPGAFVWGVIAFLLNFLPYIGGFIGTIMVAGFALVAFDSLGYALLAPLGYQMLTAIEGQLITPWMVGRRLSMNTVAVFLTVVVWAWLWGMPGALVAVPFLVVFKAICDNFEPLRIYGNLLSGDDNGKHGEASGYDEGETSKASDPVASPGE